MAVFRDDSDSQRLDYSLLQNCCVTLYYRPEFLAEDVEQLKLLKYQIDNFDCAIWKTQAEMHTAIADAPEFPPYYGRNLDAMNDCLADIDVPDVGGRVLVFHRYDIFTARMPQVAWGVLDLIAINSRLFLLFGQRLLALVQSADPQIKFNDIGAQSADWNRREWLNAHRGL